MKDYKPYKEVEIDTAGTYYPYQALSLYKGEVRCHYGENNIPSNSQEYIPLGQVNTYRSYNGELKPCRIYNFKHYNKVSGNSNISNLRYFNLKNVKFINSINYELNAQKLATRKIVDNSWDWEKLIHIEYNK
jgi:hypothetical protein